MHLALAAFIFYAARTEEAHVLYEERRRSAAYKVATRRECGWHLRDTAGSHRGNGLWQLAPLGTRLPGTRGGGRLGMALISIVELGVAEAYDILTGHFGVRDLPPLDAIENEDWGRDYLLSRLFELPAAELRPDSSRGRGAPMRRQWTLLRSVQSACGMTPAGRP